MAKTLMKALHTEMTADLPAVAALLQKKGRGKDTILAHITPKEAALLKARGGRGSKNPDTGLLEFDDSMYNPYNPEYSFDSPSSGFSTEFAPLGGQVNQNPYYQEAAPSQYNLAANIPEAPGMGGAAGVGVQGQLAAPEAPVTTPFATGTPVGVAKPQANITPDQYAPLIQGAVGGLQPPSAAPKVAAAPAAPAAPGAPTTDSSLIAQLNKALGTNLSAGQVLGGGALGALGVSQAQNAAAQAQQAKQELMKQAAPYQTQGAQQVAAAQAGQLSPASQQAYEAARARAAQAGQAAGGGVGVVQSQAALESLRQQLLAGDLNVGLQIEAIGDKIAQGAITAGIQADQYVNQLTGSYASNIARVLMGVTPGTTGNTSTTGVTA